jgi:coenzyme F420 hydrogenase subunit beta
MKPGFTALKESIIDTGLCTRCGGCSAVCPVDAISFTTMGMKLTGKCINCGNCMAICPGGGVDMAFHESRLFNSARRSEMGRGLGIIRRKKYLRASDPEIFKKGYFGGRVSALLIHALEKKMIDAALLTDWSGRYNLSIGKGIIARTRKDILDAASSKYVFSPVLGLLKNVADDNSIRSIAVVGLPCHVHALRKMEDYGPTSRLTEKVSYVISLNCGGPNLSERKWGEVIQEVTEVPVEEIESFNARKKSGRILRFTVRRKDGAIREEDISFIDYLKKINSKGVWERCRMCPDYSGELSDITFGSPYIRTGKGEELIITSLEAGVLETDSLKRKLYQMFIDSVLPRKKRRNARNTIRRRKKERLPVPVFSSGSKND